MRILFLVLASLLLGCNPKSEDTGQPPPVQDADGDGYVVTEDCDDADPSIHPGADEVCDGLDDDCDGEVDEDLQETWYADDDGDGYGNPGDALDDCDPGTGWVADASDCDDADADAHPGVTESCDGADNDCDGTIDEDDAADARTWYVDGDADGFGDAAASTQACDQPSGFVADHTDCDDSRVGVNPAATELCNGLDDDCNGAIDESSSADATTWFADDDADGFGDAATSTDACAQPGGYVSDATDCDDTLPEVNPAATELCNGLDDDCDGLSDEDDAADTAIWFADADADGFGDAATSTDACAQPGGYVSDATDCDDTLPEVNPAAAELCNGLDDDCNAVFDDDYADDAPTWYADADADGYGDALTPTPACSVPSGSVADDSDCDDSDPAVNPAATERCDGLDDDCNGVIDDDADDAPTWYADDDADGFGDAGVATQACDPPSGSTDDATDCDDGRATVNPTATEICNGLDDDCDGLSDEDDAADTALWFADGDGDGFGDPTTGLAACSAPSGYVSDDSDCDDAMAGINPTATEICDGLDDDCDGTIDEDDATDALIWFTDADADGYGDPTATARACDAPSGHVDDSTDCDDEDGAVNPAATEVCDGYDDDCDGATDEDDATDAPAWYLDVDSDGYGEAAASHRACSAPGGYVASAADCDDADPGVHPGAPEYCNGYDDDCDGITDEDDAADVQTWYADVDGDGFGLATAPTDACAQPGGFVADPTDCDDTRAGVNPAATELCNGLDDDCSGVIDDAYADDAPSWYADADADGYGDASVADRACAQPSGYVASASDCDDTDLAVHPAATELCNGLDDDCDGTTDEDDAADARTWYADDDLDGFGNTSDSTRACSSPSGYANVGGDCDDLDATIYPGATETCDGVDEDCDGSADDGLATSTWFYDDDGDGWGNPSDYDDLCMAPSGAVATSGDCDDLDATIHPGASETCDGVDEDCDGDVDEGFTSGCDSLACTGTGLIASISDGCMDDGGGSAGGDALYIFCIDSIARFCLSGEYCKFNPTPSSDDGTTCDRSGLGSDYMVSAWCSQWNGHYYYYCDSSGQIYFP